MDSSNEEELDNDSILIVYFLLKNNNIGISESIFTAKS